MVGPFQPQVDAEIFGAVRNAPVSAKNEQASKPDKPTWRRNQDGRKGSTALRMTLGPDEEFERIAREAVSQADKVKCGMDEYQTGLRFLIGELEICLQASKEMGPQ